MNEPTSNMATIYTDPITREIPEGEAELLRVVAPDPRALPRRQRPGLPAHPLARPIRRRGCRRAHGPHRHGRGDGGPMSYLPRGTIDQTQEDPDPTTLVVWKQHPGRRFVAAYRSWDLEVLEIEAAMWRYKATSPLYGMISGCEASMGAAMVEALRAADHPAVAR